ncbi:helix-turn-helix transcriptional regulator [Paludibacter sp. 221]|uniref:S24 family peptidase n=1 Tax=Paludibacter sp. 221 TaxID=2302939 RepID=UPI0013D89DC3|nr:S24 family peptidase [Paludibacter sp. 221]NDV45477.1 helix-turn-helix transcriptional regulator [Paludibacter sp. 221]
MIKERIIQFIEYKGIPKEEFYLKIGMTSASFRGNAKKTPLNSNAIENILSEIPDINPEWLLTGKGEMIKGENELVKTKITPYKLKTDGAGMVHQEIPLYELEASAGLTTLFSSDVNQIPVDFISVPNAPKCDGAIFVRGDSMYPILKAGDIVCYKTIHSIESIYYGEMYLIDINVEGDQYLTFKYVQKSDKGDEYLCLVSQNPHHAPKDIFKSDIRALAIVKLSIRYNTNV